MVYVDKNYSRYKYLVEASDNYIILTNQRTAGYYEGIDTEKINIIYQYLEPSTMVIEDTKNVRYFTEYKEIDNITSEFWERPDISNIMVCSTIITILVIFIINGISKFAIKGGIFGAQ